MECVSETPVKAAVRRLESSVEYVTLWVEYSSHSGQLFIHAELLKMLLAQRKSHEE